MKIRLGLGAFKIGQMNQSSECLLQCLNTKVISVLVTWNVHSLCFRNCLKNIIQNQFQLAQPLLIGRRTKEKQKLAYLGLAQLVSMTFSHTSMIAIWEGVLGDLGVVEFFCYLTWPYGNSNGRSFTLNYRRQVIPNGAFWNVFEANDCHQ